MSLEKFLDHEGWLSASSPPNLKSIFDNLRSYPLLAVYFSVTFLIGQSGKFGSFVTAIFLFFIFAVLLLLALLQTLQLVASLFMYAFFPEGKKIEKWVLIPVFIFMLFFGNAIFYSLILVTHQLSTLSFTR